MRTSDFDFTLPKELIAQTPAKQRDQSRLLIVNRASETISHGHFVDLPNYLAQGDVLVLNDSRVIHARLRAVNPKTGGVSEVFLVEEVAANEWWTLMRPGKRAKPGVTLRILDRAKNLSPFCVTVEEVNLEGHRRLRFTGSGNIFDALTELGEVPLPPYIERAGENAADRERYQTIYARAAGSVAAPTAGLHFTPEVFAALRARGAQICFVTLHVGLGTFSPVKSEDLSEHAMHYERYEISSETAQIIRDAKIKGRRVVAVGTTTVRVLEGAGSSAKGRTNIFIHPPHRFNMVDALVTNFHLPRSTLLMLVSAFAAPEEIRGRDLILRAYGEAMANRYRFFSYGDAMLIM